MLAAFGESFAEIPEKDAFVNLITDLACDLYSLFVVLDGDLELSEVFIDNAEIPEASKPQNKNKLL